MKIRNGADLRTRVTLLKWSSGIVLVLLATRQAQGDTLAPFRLPGSTLSLSGRALEEAPSDRNARLANLDLKPAGKDTPPEIAPAPKTPDKTEPSVRSPFSFGADLYFGITNVQGRYKRSLDGVWASNSFTFPSALSINWKGDETHTAHVSVGVGDLYATSGATLKQPVEAYFQAPGASGETLTFGKFYVPFAAQEWEWETKYGVMFQKNFRQMSYTASLNYNFERRSPNAYFRAGRRLSAKTGVGVSAAFGRGVFSNSSHGTALGADFSQDLGASLFTAEAVFAHSPSGDFNFIYGKLAFTRTGRFLPFLGAYYWRDASQELGRFNCLQAGVGYRLNTHLTLEGSYARGDRRDLFAFQSHIVF